MVRELSAFVTRWTVSPARGDAPHRESAMAGEDLRQVESAVQRAIEAICCRRVYSIHLLAAIETFYRDSLQPGKGLASRPGDAA